MEQLEIVLHTWLGKAFASYTCAFHACCLSPTRVILGMKVLLELSVMETLNERPVNDCTVTKCGQLTPHEFAKAVCR